AAKTRTTTGASSTTWATETSNNQATSRTSPPTTSPDTAAALVFIAPTLAVARASQRTPIAWLSSARDGAELLVRGRLHRRVPGLPLQFQHLRLRAAGHCGSREAGPRRWERPGRRGDRRPRRADGRWKDRGAPQRARYVPRSPLGAAFAGRRRVARLLAA